MAPLSLEGLLIKMELAACSLAVYLELCESPIMARSHLDLNQDSLTNNNPKLSQGRPLAFWVLLFLSQRVARKLAFGSCPRERYTAGIRGRLIFEVETQKI